MSTFPLPPTRKFISLLPLAIFLAVAIRYTWHSGPFFLTPLDSDSDDDAMSELSRLVNAVSLHVPHTSRRVVVVTAVNFAFREYLINLNCSLRRARASRPVRLLVVTLDARMKKWARRMRFESVYIGPAGVVNASEEAVFGTSAFNLLSKRKLYAVYRVLKTGVDVLFTDADIVWCGDVVGEVVRLMYGEWAGAVGRRPGLLMQTAWPRSILNSGFYYARANEDVVRLFEAFLAYGGDAENDQVIVNRVLCRVKGEGEVIYEKQEAVHASEPIRTMPLGCRWKGRLDVRILKAGRFPTGGKLVQGGKKLFHLTRREVMGMCDRDDVALLHNNCILSRKKKARFVVKGIWYVDEKGEGCLGKSARATMKMRRLCGGAKCGEEGDVNRYPDLELR